MLSQTFGHFYIIGQYLYRVNYDGAGSYCFVCALRQSYRTSPESSRAALSGNVSYAYWLMENSDSEPGKCFSDFQRIDSIMTVAVISKSFPVTSSCL